MTPILKAMKKIMTHDEVMEDLAIAKGGIAFMNACLGSAWKPGKTPRADLVVCNPSYTRFLLSIYEVKVSRSDFLSDIRSEKWRSYLPHCHRFYFAVTEGVCRKHEIPEEAGLVVLRSGWSTAKTAPRLQTEIPAETLMSLVFMRQRRSAREKRLDDLEDIKRMGRRATDWGGRSKLARVLGEETSLLMAAASEYKTPAEAANVLRSEAERRRHEEYERWKAENRK